MSRCVTHRSLRGGDTQVDYRNPAREEAAAAAELFLDDSYWRDLVAFTWNIKTVEGPDGIRDLLEHTLARTKPRNWHHRRSRRPRPRA